MSHLANSQLLAARNGRCAVKQFDAGKKIESDTWGAIEDSVARAAAWSVSAPAQTSVLRSNTSGQQRLIW